MLFRAAPGAESGSALVLLREPALYWSRVGGTTRSSVGSCSRHGGPIIGRGPFRGRSQMPSWLGPFLVFDIIVTMIVVAVITKRLKFNINIKVNSSGPIDVKGLIQFAKDEHGKIGDYLRANFSGQPEMLPGVLEALLDQL